MTFEMPKTKITPPGEGTAVRGFLDEVSWVDDAALALKSLTAAEYQPTVTNSAAALRSYVLDGTKTATDSVDFRDAVVMTPYLRRHFSAGEATYAEAKARTMAEFEAGLEDYVVRTLIANADVTDISPGGTCTLVEAVGMIERALLATNGSRSGLLLLPPLVSARFTNYAGDDNRLPSGNRMIFSPGATPTAELTTLDSLPADATVYGCFAPFGLKTEPEATSSVIADDFDRTTNDIYVTVESTVVIGFNSTAQMYACTTS